MEKRTEDLMQEKKKCFIITPIGNPNTEIRRKADGVIYAIIKPVVEELGFELFIPHKMTDPGSITQQVIKHILNDELVIANLTGLNANVMYELATRHAVQKPIVCIAEEGLSLPFDINAERTLFYTDDLFEVEGFKKKLSDTIKSAMNDKTSSNPIYRAKSDFAMHQVVAEDKDKYILEKLETLSNQIDHIQMTISRNERKLTKDEHFTFSQLGVDDPIRKKCIDSARAYIEDIERMAKSAHLNHEE